MTPTPPHAVIPDPEQRAALNAALHATANETGLWDDHGRPAPWPHDIDDWRLATNAQITPRTRRTTLLTKINFERSNNTAGPGT